MSRAQLPGEHGQEETRAKKKPSNPLSLLSF